MVRDLSREHGVHRRALPFGTNLSLSLHGFVIFLGAFLLFLLQPMVGKTILPWFGGGAAVWTSCLVFFQAALLGGYLYAHMLSQRLGRRTLWLHLALIGVALLLMPILPSVRWKPVGADHPILKIFAMLGSTIGLPFLILASTSPLLQKWLADDHPDINPFRFYALSNAGSLLALASYPLLFEPLLSLRAQSYLWSALFLLYGLVLMVLSINKRVTPLGPHTSIQKLESTPPKFWDVFLWILLSSLPSALLVSATTHMSTNIAPIPFLWVLPLGLYLVSFILCFDHPRWYRRLGFLCAFFPALLTMALLVSEQHESASIWKVIPIFSCCFFIACMVAHGELAKLKPAPHNLTRFYLCIATGGCLGGLVPSVIAPTCFSAQYELPLILMVFAILPVTTLPRHSSQFIARPWFRIALNSAAGIAGVFSGVVLVQRWQMVRESRAATRSFYGSLMVIDSGSGENELRTLVDGNIDHGSQFVHPNRQSWITTYFSPESGVGRAFMALPPSPRKVGIIGLGAGTLASYGRKGDEFHFFEINPDVVALARNEFGFLPDCPATTRIVLGDARLSLETLPSQGYHMLVVDAFSSDMIPVHLLTYEAFREYSRHLRDDGVLSIHVSNRYLDLVPVVRGAGNTLGMKSQVVVSMGDLSKGIAPATWVILKPGSVLGSSPEPSSGEPLAASEPARSLLWTDDYSSLVSVVRPQNLGSR